MTSSCPAGNVGHTWKKVQKMLNATGIFQQENIDQVLVCSASLVFCFVLFCLVFSPASLSHSFYCGPCSGFPECTLHDFDGVPAQRVM